MIADQIKVWDDNSGLTNWDIEFKSDPIVIRGIYEISNRFSLDGSSKGVTFVPDEPSRRLFPHHTSFDHSIELFFQDPEVLRQFGPELAGEAKIKVEGYHEKVTHDYNYDLSQNTTFVELLDRMPDFPAADHDVAFSDFHVPSGFINLRELVDDQHDKEAGAVYILHEFELTGSLVDADNWLRDEASRLDAKLSERYSYKAGESLDLIIHLPAKSQTRLLSTYSPMYDGKYHLVIEETIFNQFTIYDNNWTDRAFVSTTPTGKNGKAVETFKGNYYVEETDIPMDYFNSQVFFEVLYDEQKYAILPHNEMEIDIGFFDKKGRPVDVDSEDNTADQIYGIKVPPNFFAKNKEEKKRLIYYYAKSLLFGDKSYSAVYDGSGTIPIFVGSKVLYTLSLKDLIKDNP